MLPPKVFWTFTKRSICECGFPVLKDDIEIGRRYEVLPSRVEDCWTFGCGGCGRRILTRVIAAREQNGRTFGVLPIGIFSEAAVLDH